MLACFIHSTVLLSCALPLFKALKDRYMLQRGWCHGFNGTGIAIAGWVNAMSFNEAFSKVPWQNNADLGYTPLLSIQM